MSIYNVIYDFLEQNALDCLLPKDTMVDDALGNSIVQLKADLDAIVKLTGQFRIVNSKVKNQIRIAKDNKGRSEINSARISLISDLLGIITKEISSQRLKRWLEVLVDNIDIIENIAMVDLLELIQSCANKLSEKIYVDSPAYIVKNEHIFKNIDPNKVFNLYVPERLKANSGNYLIFVFQLELNKQYYLITKSPKDENLHKPNISDEIFFEQVLVSYLNNNY